jgi:hypothetical protein
LPRTAGTMQRREITNGPTCTVAVQFPTASRVRRWK